jgi:hypothetical protein
MTLMRSVFCSLALLVLLTSRASATDPRSVQVCQADGFLRIGMSHRDAAKKQSPTWFWIFRREFVWDGNSWRTRDYVNTITYAPPVEMQFDNRWFWVPRDTAWLQLQVRGWDPHRGWWMMTHDSYQPWPWR